MACHDVRSVARALLLATALLALEAGCASPSPDASPSLLARRSVTRGSGTSLEPPLRAVAEPRVQVPGRSSTPAPLHVLFLAGQSNVLAQEGTVTPAGVPEPAIPLLARSLGPPGFEYDTGSEPVALDAINGFHSAEISAALALRARGWRTAVVKLARGGSWLGEWLPGAPTQYWERLLEQRERAIAALGPDLVWHFVWLQSESDAQQPKYAEAYEANLRQFSTAVHELLGSEFTQCKLQPRLGANSGTGPTIRAVQVRVMGEQPWSHLLDLDDLNGNLHYSSPELAVIGDRIATLLTTAREDR